jgi:hypothetical protein
MRLILAIVALAAFSVSPSLAAAQATDIAYHNVVDRVDALLPSMDRAIDRLDRWSTLGCARLGTPDIPSADATVWRQELSLQRGSSPILETFRPAWEDLDLGMQELQTAYDTVILASTESGHCLFVSRDAMRNMADPALVAAAEANYADAALHLRAGADLLRTARQKADAALTQ